MRRARFAIALLVAAVVVLAALAAGASGHGHGKVLLGSKHFDGPASKGFGTPHPRYISNGGDASGTITHVTWRHWGHRTAKGHGKNWIFKPGGGYYRKPVTIDLKSEDLGRCRGSRHLAYRKLMFREPRRPGGPKPRHWRSWSGRQSIC